MDSTKLMRDIKEGDICMGFIIKCTNCGQLSELEDGFFKKANEIQVYDSGEFLVSIKCTGCGNEVVSNYEE